MSVILFLVTGLVAGWVAANLIKGQGFGLLGNLVVGVIGAMLGGYLFRVAGIESVGLLGSFLTAVVGAVVLLFLVGMVRRSR